MNKSFAIPLVGAIGILATICGAGQMPAATADPTIQSEPTYCTGTNYGPEAGPRQDGKDTVQGTVDIQCDQNQWVEVISHITGDGHDWTDDIAAMTTPDRLFTSNNHKVGGDLNGQVYTVDVTVKVWTASTVFCSGPNCYPFGTPLRTFTLPGVSAPVYD